MDTNTIEIVEGALHPASSTTPPRRLPADPERLDKVRSDCAMLAIKAFREATGTDACAAVSDLISSLMHMCDLRPEHGKLQEQFERGEYHCLFITAS